MGLSDEVVDAQEQKRNNETEEHYAKFREDLKMYDPEGYEELRTQDQQIVAVQRADAE